MDTVPTTTTVTATNSMTKQKTSMVAAKKGPTTIFPMKRMMEKRKEAGKPNKSTMAVKPIPEGGFSDDDEEFLRAAEALEQVVTVSDEELMEAVASIEQLQIVGGEEHGQPGPQLEGVSQVHAHQDHPRQEVQGKEATHSPNLKLSPKMMINHHGWNQEPKVGTGGQASHGLGAPQAQGGHHQVGHGGDEEEGVEGGPGEAAKSQHTPPSTASSKGSPPSPAGTPGRGHPRVVVTPLWKRKSNSRMSSLSRSPRKAIRRMTSLTQTVRSPAPTPSQSVVSKFTASNTTMKSMVSPTPMKARPGSQNPPIVSLLTNPYYPEQSADTTARPTEGRETCPMTGEEPAHGD